MHGYEHTQPGTFIRILIGVSLLAVGAIVIALLAAGYPPEETIGLGVPVIILAIVLPLFHSLTVRISHNEITLAFGTGLIRKRFINHDVQSATIVRNRWYYGWGIRKIRGGWLFNVSGFDAVEIQLRNGRTYRIGTDRPKDLLTAIQTAINEPR
jgi:hypothetical protein